MAEETGWTLDWIKSCQYPAAELHYSSGHTASTTETDVRLTCKPEAEGKL